MELSVLVEVFQQRITDFPGGTPPAVFASSMHNGFVASYGTTGASAFLFVTPSGAWLWNHVQESVPVAGLASKLCIFEVEVTSACLYITDVLVYETTVLTSRDYLERVEAARKWMHLSFQGCKVVVSDPHACRSAYPQYVLQVPEWQVRVQCAYPAFELDTLWARRPSETRGIVYHRTLDRYRPHVKKKGRPS